ncbi:MAG: Pycsar system effector family protein [Bacteroidota bacterium]
MKYNIFDMSEMVLSVEKHVVHLLNNELDPKFVYHNLTHTQHVVSKAREFGELTKCTKHEIELLEIAAWFHDTGFIIKAEGHEEESVKIAEAFLSSSNYPQKSIKTISQIILATQMSHVPYDKLEGIIRDADSSHTGDKNYEQVIELLRKEWELVFYKKLTEIEWLTENIEFLSIKHRFFTNEVAAKLEKTKSKNLASLIKKNAKLRQEKYKFEHKKEELALKKSKKGLPERGIETMFRVALRNHITLSDIADTKANILLSVNAIIISLVLSNLVSKLDNPSNYYLIWPTAIFAISTVVSIILSVLATRPNVTSGKFSKEDVAQKKVNLIFFGNFHKMNLGEFEWAMKEMMQDRDYLYSSLTKDLYFLGLVLNRKYNLLRLTYTVFAIGIIISVIAFGIAFQFS